LLILLAAIALNAELRRHSHVVGTPHVGLCPTEFSSRIDFSPTGRKYRLAGLRGAS
jgi:hypothetical protein